MLAIKRILAVCVRSPVVSSIPPTLYPRNFSAKAIRPGMGSKLVWVDMEMTGLNHNTDRILEVACIVTDKDLNQLDPGIEFVVHQPDSVLTSMNEWCIDHHAKTGLTEACRNSKLSIGEVEEQLLSYLSRFLKPKASPMAGNSVYMDRLFMRNEMPKLDEFLHYRLVDVSTIKELCRRWQPEVYQKAPAKRLTHRALEDIQDSIEELKYYRSSFFIPGRDPSE